MASDVIRSLFVLVFYWFSKVFLHKTHFCLYFGLLGILKNIITISLSYWYIECVVPLSLHIIWNDSSRISISLFQPNMKYNVFQRTKNLHVFNLSRWIIFETRSSQHRIYRWPKPLKHSNVYILRFIYGHFMLEKIEDDIASTYSQRMTDISFR